MGRQVRRVPDGWEHPKDGRDHYIPLFGRSFACDLAEWEEGRRQWDAGFMPDFTNGGYKPRDAEHGYAYEQWDGPKREAKDYMPDWPDAERTHLQMYEDTTEGTPISPVMGTPEELAHWLADNRASACGNETASYEAWLAMINGSGHAPSMISSPQAGFVNGVEGLYGKTQL